MLVRLSLENFFFIKGEELYFDRGLTVITGETGTGKSLTVSSLLFLMGREGEYPEGTCVEAELDLGEEQVVLRREIVKGRSKYYLNGRGSTRRVVEEVLSSNILLQGQNDRTKILRVDFQREVYDRFVGCVELRRAVEGAYEEVLELEEKLKSINQRKIEREVRKRLISEEIKQIEEVGLKPEEYEFVKKRIEEINLAERVNNIVFQGLSNLERSMEGLRELKRALRELLNIGVLQDKTQSFQLLEDYLVDLERELKSKVISYSQEELDQLNEKVYKVQRLERKYRKDYRDIYGYMLMLREELDKLQEEENTELLERGLNLKRDELYRLYEELSKKRLLAREEFEKKVMEYLKSMGLEGASFRVSFERKEGRYGREQVRFLFSSYGKEERDISEVASGGEISRLSLALFMLSPPAQTYVLDEVDTGISGITSIKLAKLLKELSKKTQLIVITHSPAIASASDKHFTTKREAMGDIPLIRVVELSEEEKIEEIARLMGAVNSKTVEGARELIKEVCGV
ncbi:AAA family ATPase [Hydrogenobacter sp. T-2]|uniref:AAA family ATPase n=1 Tax=Pampinifervens diazotrophicum TaxID=1632018 RepID=UPI002B2642D5|nr:AAA family ATPase [Hydrogenobacter sp. T-2]WPM31841.1 AAA family ATPase [Hydrogenobacter sp. T-2]